MILLRYLALGILMIAANISKGQDLSPQQRVQATIDSLFHSMRTQDTSLAKSLFTEQATLSSVSLDQSRNAQKRTNQVQRLIKGIGKVRDEVWDEHIWSYDIRIDFPLAMAWTEYSFFVDDKLSHCGVNVFELIHRDGQWLISSLTDTRRKVGCQTRSILNINMLIDNWHQAAVVADEDLFFGSMTRDGIYIGTDASERWTTSEMQVWAQEYFKRDTAWAFTPLERNISLNQEENIGWFDELLDTWMGTCRGSGVVVKSSNGWKIKHYHLSIAVPNEKVNGYLDLIGLPIKKTTE